MNGAECFSAHVTDQPSAFASELALPALDLLQQEHIGRQRMHCFGYGRGVDPLAALQVPGDQNRRLHMTTLALLSHAFPLVIWSAVGSVLSHDITIVELRGIEPLTPSMPWKCSTN